jgi:hypothetical protein
MKFLSQAVPRLHLQATALHLNRSGALSALVGRAPRANVLPPYVEARPSSLRASSQQDAAHSQKKQLACASIVGFDTIEGETEQTLRAEKSGARLRLPMAGAVSVLGVDWVSTTDLAEHPTISGPRGPRAGSEGL